MKISPLLNSELLENLEVVDWGYTEDPIPSSFAHYEKWVEEKKHGPLNYLSDYRKDLRGDLRKVYPEFQSALVFLFSYKKTKKWMLENNHHSVASYALGFEGEDYHYNLKNRLQLIAESLSLQNFFLSIDMQPVLERDLAARAGLGWFGKNSMLINRKEGSYFIIGSLLLDRKLPIEKSKIDTDHCGQCTACGDACPTKAIDLETRTLIADKCISTYTIELFRETPPPAGFEQSRGEIFGCDICQDVCPWNRKPLARTLSELKLKDSFSFLKEWFFIWTRENFLEYINQQTNRGLKKKFFGTVFERPGKEGWQKNLKAIISSRNGSSKKHRDEV